MFVPVRDLVIIGLRVGVRVAPVVLSCSGSCVSGIILRCVRFWRTCPWDLGHLGVFAGAMTLPCDCLPFMVTHTSVSSGISGRGLAP